MKLTWLCVFLVGTQTPCYRSQRGRARHSISCFKKSMNSTLTTISNIVSRISRFSLEKTFWRWPWMMPKRKISSCFSLLLEDIKDIKDKKRGQVYLFIFHSHNSQFKIKGQIRVSISMAIGWVEPARDVDVDSCLASVLCVDHDTILAFDWSTASKLASDWWPGLNSKLRTLPAPVSVRV